MRYVVALGMFDGVHKGHRALLCHAAKIAEQNGCTSVAFTYRNHPKALFGGVQSFLCSMELRERLMRSCGIRRVDAVVFDAAFAARSPEAFIEELAARYESLHTVVAGFDFRFGAGAKGDADLLKTLGNRHGFAVSVVPPVLFEGMPCASTRVRELLDRGDVQTAWRMLERPYRLDGVVESGRHRGHRLGFPTANIRTDSLYLPKEGVYASALVADGIVYRAVTNIGNNPTFQNTSCTVETHVTDGEPELYGKTVSVLLLAYLREEQRFLNEEDLKHAIGADVETAKKVFENHKKSVYNSILLC